ncbi:hypothetical protein NMY22_g8021 [Coprinellus aureogranulatus]|nr:hypothetical protein NMY22_g8021 [Coprinellus aureogranulatus]
MSPGSAAAFLLSPPIPIISPLYASRVPPPKPVTQPHPLSPAKCDPFQDGPWSSDIFGKAPLVKPIPLSAVLDEKSIGISRWPTCEFIIRCSIAGGPDFQTLPQFNSPTASGVSSALLTLLMGETEVPTAELAGLADLQTMAGPSPSASSITEPSPESSLPSYNDAFQTHLGDLTSSDETWVTVRYKAGGHTPSLGNDPFEFLVASRAHQNFRNAFCVSRPGSISPCKPEVEDSESLPPKVPEFIEAVTKIDQAHTDLQGHAKAICHITQDLVDLQQEISQIHNFWLEQWPEVAFNSLPIIDGARSMLPRSSLVPNALSRALVV